jgi:hypothetical protein
VCRSRRGVRSTSELSGWIRTSGIGHLVFDEVVSIHSGEQDITVDPAMGSTFAGKELINVKNSSFHIADSLPDRPSGM